MMTEVLAIYRAECFSPNSVSKDKAILESVCGQLDARTYNIRYVREENWNGRTDARLILTMARGRQTLDALARAEAAGAAVVNSTAGVRACTRATVDSIMRREGIPAAPAEGSDGYWIKRGDEAAQSPEDVQYAHNAEEKDIIEESFRRRGVASTVVTAHVRGEHVKFYGVRGSDFFHLCYPEEDGCTMPDNGLCEVRQQHFSFSREALRRDVSRLAEHTGATVYGGDCIVRGDGTYVIIDFNDWPSFSSCREEAAAAIAEAALKALETAVRSNG